MEGLWKEVEEMDLGEISVATNLPVSTVKSHLYRALAIIRARHTSPLKDTL